MSTEKLIKRIERAMKECQSVMRETDNEWSQSSYAYVEGSYNAYKYVLQELTNPEEN